MLVGYISGGFSVSSTSWRNVYRLLNNPWDFPQPYTLTANMFLSGITMFLLASPAPTDVTVSLYARPFSLAEITREISQQSHTLTANKFLSGTTMFLFPSSAPTDVTRVSLRETSQPCWNNPWDFPTVSHVKSEQVPQWDNHVPVSVASSHWRNLVSPPRPLSVAKKNRCPRQRPFGRLSNDVPKIP